MELYILENYKEMFPPLKGRELTDRLTAAVLKECGKTNFSIIRDKNGKPLTDLPGVFISVSHSGAYFSCLISDRPVGVDMQETRKISSHKIAGRYFSEKEREYIRERGEKGFFELWTRKEAYSKYTGNGIKDIIAGVTVIGRDDVEFLDFQIGDGMYLSCCIQAGNKVRYQCGF